MLTICQIKQLAREFNLIFDHYDTHLIDLTINHPLFEEKNLTVFRFRLHDKLFRINAVPFKRIVNDIYHPFYTIEHVHFKDHRSPIADKDGNLLSYHELYELLSLFMADVNLTHRQMLLEKKLSSIEKDFK